MKVVDYKILLNEKIAKNTFKMVLSGKTDKIRPGQFINIKLNDFFLRRPISVCDVGKNKLTIIYKTVGKGTIYLSLLKEGQIINALTNLGNSFNLEKSGKNPVLIGGGAGIPPLYFLAKELKNKNITPTVILGFNEKDEVFFEDEFNKLNVNLIVLTRDGSYKRKGLVTDVLKDLEYSFFYTCGPSPMFKAIEQIAKTNGQYSFEERMGCGFGACMGCSCKTKYATKRICVDGPIFDREEIIW